MKRILALTGVFGSWFGLAVLADDWPQWLGPQRDSVWRETRIVERFDSNGPPVLWRTPIGAGYSGPSVANHRVYVTDRQLANGAKNPSDPFQRGEIAGSERVLCLDEASGKILWKNEYEAAYTISYPSGPRVAPLVDGDRLYSLGAEGKLLCLNTSDGSMRWSKDLKKAYEIPTPMWGFAGHPLLDGNRLICLVGGTGTVCVAFEKQTGKELWRALSAKEPGYSSPMMFQDGGRRELIIANPEGVNGLEPATGKLLWTEPTPAKFGMTIATPRQMGNSLFFTTFYNGSLMLRVDSAKATEQVRWRTQKPSEKDTTHLNAVLCTPFLEDGYIYGVCSYGQLRCLNAHTGERLWETFKATTGGEQVRWANAFIVKNGKHFFLFNEHGDLIIAKMSPQGYEEISRAHLLEPMSDAAGRAVLWSHPAFANHHMYARNDREIISVNLEARAASTKSGK
jgi:outer membrane protein assembly factor BamB